MISIFSKPFKVNVLPHKRNLWLVIVITSLILILNLSVNVLCVLVLIDNFKNNSKIIFAISSINIMIIICSIVVESISTHVSEHIYKECIKVVEKIKKNNILMNLDSVEKNLFRDCNEKYKVVIIISKFIKYFSIFVCIVCVISAVLCDFPTDLVFIKIIAIILSVLSTFISIYQTFFSTVSCFLTGTYTSALFTMLYDYSKEISVKYNDAATHLSHK